VMVGWGFSSAQDVITFWVRCQTQQSALTPSRDWQEEHCMRLIVALRLRDHISIATNTGWVFNTRFLLYLIHNCVVLHTNRRYCAQCAHSDAARELRFIIQRSIQESWIVVKFVTLF
jgi:hypothetical protein